MLRRATVTPTALKASTCLPSSPFSWRSMMKAAAQTVVTNTTRRRSTLMETALRKVPTMGRSLVRKSPCTHIWSRTYHSNAADESSKPPSSPSSSPSAQEQQSIWIAKHLQQHHPHLLGSLSVCHPSTPFLLGFGVGGDDDAVMSEPPTPPSVEAVTALSLSSSSSSSSSSSFVTLKEHPGGKTPKSVAAPHKKNTTYNKPKLSVLGRNTRKVKKPNHGARPCNRLGRRAKARRFGNPKRTRSS